MPSAATLTPTPNSLRAAAKKSSGDVKEVSNRLVSLDVYRGFVMFLMASSGFGIIRYVNNTQATGIWQTLAHHVDHIDWRGCTLWDLIQPSFTFIAGVSLPFSLAKRCSQGQSFGRLLFHAVWRSLLLVWLGIFLRSTGKSQTNFTFEDTLTQIGLGYTFLFLLAWLRPRWQVVALAAILVGYWAAFAIYPLPGPDFNYAAVGVKSDWLSANGLSGFAAHWNKNSNLAWAFDTWFLNLFPRPEHFAFNRGGYATLSFLPTLATMILGLQAGNLMKSSQPAHKKVLALVVGGIIGLGVGFLLDYTGICPSVKRIWTPSWVLFSGGWACLLLAAFYTLIDLANLRLLAFPLVVVGMNSIAMYVLADGGFKEFIQDNIYTHFGRRIFVTLAGDYAPIAQFSTLLLILWLILFWMYRRKIFLRI